MNARLSAEWTTDNRQRLAAEFARLVESFESRTGHASAIDAGSAPSRPAPRERLAAEAEGNAAIDRIAAAFDLSDFERDILLLAAGVEMDAALAAREPQPSLGAALASLPSAHWNAVTPMAPLRAWRLIELEAGSPLQARLRIDERMLHALVGIDQLDARLQPLLRAQAPPTLMAAAHRSEARRLSSMLGRGMVGREVVQLAGDDAEGQLDFAAEVAGRLGRNLYVLSIAEIPASPAEQEALALLWRREALMLPAALCIDTQLGEGARSSPNGHDDSAGAFPGGLLSRFVGRLGGLVFIASREPTGVKAAFHVRIDKPDAAGQRQLWNQALADLAAPAESQAAVLPVASQFRLSAASIARQAASIKGGLGTRDAGDLGVLSSSLWRACCEQARSRLETLAQRIEPAAGWSDLVLPEAPMALLRQLAAQVGQRSRVYSEWGFEAQGTRGLGISALFVGESGTGKTMACEVLARELQLDLYRIDLSSVVSKYIGETEKNLRSVFDAAEDSGALLLFDEADALFGKRSEVKDSHDRYANIEVGYLLQRMESYRGLAVLTTNQRAALDPAFLRRLRFVVQFPFPDSAQREAIWRGVFPAAMPRGAIDPAGLARVPMAGGRIRNIALNAAFLAAEDGRPLGMDHLLRATHQEAAKNERPLPESQTRGWVP
ncbi:putative ATPase, AAA family [Burkholderiales bacterium 8X]|nr:putative ATPase, AAA family [Burkholderiales bacterium 8X]